MVYQPIITLRFFAGRNKRAVNYFLVNFKIVQVNLQNCYA